MRSNHLLKTLVLSLAMAGCAVEGVGLDVPDATAPESKPIEQAPETHAPPSRAAAPGTDVQVENQPDVVPADAQAPDTVNGAEVMPDTLSSVTAAPDAGPDVNPPNPNCTDLMVPSEVTSWTTCPDWAANGMCGSIWSQKQGYCQKSCGTCKP